MTFELTPQTRRIGAIGAYFRRHPDTADVQA